MEWWKDEGRKLEKEEGNLVATGGKYLICKGSFAGISNAIEQQLQTQKGVHVSSPHPFECWWSFDTC